MAVPESYTMLDLTGRFERNAALSSAPEITMPPPWKDIAPSVWRDLAINHFKDDDGQERLWLSQLLRRDAPPTEGEWIVDWQERKKENPVLGPIIGQMRRVKTAELDAHFLRAGWTPDTRRHGVLQRIIRGTWSGRDWSLTETFGIEEVDGARHLARHVRTMGKGEDGHEYFFNWRVVYDYVGEID
uniref:N-acetyltransferase domain-containing protein n=1 Tax=Mycena chlorophos TaxID=658473 RepID=A0ABQ0LCA0_MYCCL|nr:predicted protein [Mycena chlorophos]